MASSSFYKIVRGLATLGAYSSGRWYLVVDQTELLITPKIFEGMSHGDLRHTTFVVHEKVDLIVQTVDWPARQLHAADTRIVGPVVVRIIWYPAISKDKLSLDYIWVVKQMA